MIARQIRDRQGLLRKETEDYLRGVILDYEPRRRSYWRRDYSSVEAFERSVAPNRQRWREALGVFEPDGTPLNPVLDLWYEDDRFAAWWVTIGLLSGLRGRGLLAVPKGRQGPAPLVIAQHGAGCSPERVFGLDDPPDTYKAYGRHLAEAGFAVMAPLNITETAPPSPRARLERMCKLLGRTVFGLEIHRTQRLLDYLETRSDIDVGRTAMYGISLGGHYTLFTVPLEPRIGAAVVCAWFNHRPNKMVVDDPRYSCFLSAEPSEHTWVPGWLREFSDSDLASLICPRPLLVEQGKADAIAWWPMMLEEYEEACEHYRRLGVADRVEIDLHEGGHEIRMEKSFEFLKRWLKP